MGNEGYGGGPGPGPGAGTIMSPRKTTTRRGKDHLAEWLRLISRLSSSYRMLTIGLVLL